MYLRIVSYINNLHPQKHEELYSIIDQIITKAIPLWNWTLSEPLSDDELRVGFELSFDPDPEEMGDEEKPQQGDDEEDDDYWERMEQWEEDTRKTVLPEPGVFEAPAEDQRPDYNLLEESAQYGLQVIVKLANIELTPEKPEYAGGTWHVEGQLVSISCLLSTHNSRLPERTHLCNCALLLRQ